MARTKVEFDPGFFDNIMKSAKVSSLTKSKAEEALGYAQQSAPVDTGDYRSGLRTQKRTSSYRDVWRVVGNDPKTLLLEAQGGYLARALKRVKK